MSTLSVLPAARVPATAEELQHVPDQWRFCYSAGFDRPLRAAQAALLAAVHSGCDVLGIAATGAGKGTVWLLPVAAAACAALQGEDDDAERSLDDLRPIDLVVVPLASQGEPHEAEACHFFDACCSPSNPPSATHGRPMFHCPRALFVRRGGPQKEVAAGKAAGPSLQEAVVRCPRGHATQYYSTGGRGERQWRLATCDCCAASIDKGAARYSCRRPVFGTSNDCNYDLCPSCYVALLAGHARPPPGARAHSSLSSPFDAASSSADGEQQPVTGPEPTPRTLPCGYCGGCKSSPTPGIRSCKWCCRDAAKRNGSLAQCKNCEKRQSWSRCLVRKPLEDAARERDHAVTSEGPSSPASPAIGTQPTLPITPPHRSHRGGEIAHPYCRTRAPAV